MADSRLSPYLLPDDWDEKHDGWDFWGDWERGEWEPGTREAIEAHVTPGSTYVDIGAWIGPTVLWAAPIAARVLALEPDPVAYLLLVENTKHFPNVNSYGWALAAEPDMMWLAPSYNHGFGSSMSRLNPPQERGWDIAGAVKVPALDIESMFDICDVHNVSLVKIDIEGGEADVMEHVGPFLAERNIKLLLSLHPWWWEASVDKDQWFGGFSSVTPVGGGAEEVLAIP